MMTLAEQVANIQARIRVVQEQAMRTEMAAQAAEAAAAASRQQLKDDFAVETTEDAAAVLTDLRRELDEIIAQLEKALSEVEQK